MWVDLASLEGDEVTSSLMKPKFPIWQPTLTSDYVMDIMDYISQYRYLANSVKQIN